MKQEIYKLNVDPEDIGDILVKIQRSFNIKLDNEGLRDVDTFGDLCDVIINKISLEHEDTCTTQHAFYMLRNSIAAVTGIDKCSVKPQTRLSQILPKENRLQIIAEIENDLGFKTNLLQPKQWIVALFSLTLIGSFIICFYNWPIGIAGLLSSGISLKLSGKFGKEMHLKTVGDLANKISKESYLRYRRNPCTINKNEVEQKVKEFFINDLDLEPIVLTRKSQF
ncbi:MAG: hypothetical protein JWQ66_2458 [Mucilaginibacter sp.]|nr:hypothetical protein [Mucilaginibacter sp.]